MSTHKPRKRFGQNFLHDPFVIHNILSAIDPKPGESLIEIGPGLGALTCPLLKACGALQVVELDRDIVPELSRRCGAEGALQIHNTDALRFDFEQLHTDERPLRIIGNLPYNISTPLIFHLLDHADIISDMHFMLQKEVVDRMASPPGSKDYGRLSVMLQYRCAVEPLFDVGPGAFNPPPKVNSAVVRLRPLAKPAAQVDDFKIFSNLVTQIFSQRRKTLRKILKNTLTTDQITDLGLDPMIRPDRLSIEDFARLANQVSATN